MSPVCAGRVMPENQPVRRAEALTSRMLFFFFQAEDGIRDYKVTGVQTCALPISGRQRELRFNFRYLETFDQQLTVPPTFKPERLNVEVSSGRRDVSPLSQTFV